MKKLKTVTRQSSRMKPATREKSRICEKIETQEKIKIFEFRVRARARPSSAKTNKKFFCTKPKILYFGSPTSDLDVL
jgi:hypothetical protein